MTTNVQFSLGELLDPIARCLTPEVARRITELRPDPAVAARVDVLAAKASEGLLTDDEKREYEGIIDAADIVGILKSKARAVLAQDSP
jgi:hypothetical protein